MNGVVPMNIDTQSARSRVWDGKDLTFGNNTTWLKGKHMISFGGELRHEHFTHTRDDKVVGALTSPVYFATRNASDINIGTDFMLPGLSSTDQTLWQNEYAAVLGMISRASQLLTRASNFSLNPPGTPLKQDTLVDWYNLYFADAWRMTPTLTVRLGLGWCAQTPPYELSGRQTIMVNAVTNQPITYTDFLEGLASAANQGQVFAPDGGSAQDRDTCAGKLKAHPTDWVELENSVRVHCKIIPSSSRNEYTQRCVFFLQPEKFLGALTCL